MAKAKTDTEKILEALEDLHTRIEDLFVSKHPELELLDIKFELFLESTWRGSRG